MALRKIPHPEEAAKRPSRRTHDIDPSSVDFLTSAFAGTMMGAIIILIFEPARRHHHRALAGKDCVYRGQVFRGDRPAQCSQVFLDFVWLAEADQRRADDGI